MPTKSILEVGARVTNRLPWDAMRIFLPNSAQILRKKSSKSVYFLCNSPERTRSKTLIFCADQDCLLKGWRENTNFRGRLLGWRSILQLLQDLCSSGGTCIQLLFWWSDGILAWKILQNPQESLIVGLRCLDNVFVAQVTWCAVWKTTLGHSSGLSQLRIHAHSPRWLFYARPCSISIHFQCTSYLLLCLLLRTTESVAWTCPNRRATTDTTSNSQCRFTQSNGSLLGKCCHPVENSGGMHHNLSLWCKIGIAGND